MNEEIEEMFSTMLELREQNEQYLDGLIQMGEKLASVLETRDGLVKELIECRGQLAKVEANLSSSRKLLDDEKLNSRKLDTSLQRIGTHLTEFGSQLPLDFMQAMAQVLPNSIGCKRTSEQHTNTTGSLISQLGVTMSEDELNASLFAGRSWRRHRPSTNTLNELEKIARAADVTHLAETSRPALSDITDIPVKDTMPKHNFQAKLVVLPVLCAVCTSRISFGTSSFKCKRCHLAVHEKCRNVVADRCKAYEQTEQVESDSNECAVQKHVHLADHIVRDTRPMLPAFLLHLLPEIERRANTEADLYSQTRPIETVRHLKEIILTNQCSDLTMTPTADLCCVVKDFFRSLVVQLIPAHHRPGISRRNARYVLTNMPAEHCDTLALLLLHLHAISFGDRQRLDSVAKIFAPILVGSSLPEDDFNHTDCEPHVELNDSYSLAVATDQRERLLIVQRLIDVPPQFWQVALLEGANCVIQKT